MANEAQVKQLLELCNACTKTAIAQLISHADRETANYEAARRALERTFDIVDQFRRLPIGLLPDRLISEIIAALRSLPASLEALAERGSPAARERAIARYCRQADRFFGAALLYNCLSCALGGRRTVSTPCAACILER